MTKITNGLYSIKLNPSPLWRTSHTRPAVFYWEGLLAIGSDRIISVSKCMGDISPDEETFNVLVGDDAMGGYIYLYALSDSYSPEPSNFTIKRSNGLPGLNSSTPWYINIKQNTCSYIYSECGFNYHIWP